MQLPGPVRAVVGLLATAADEARRLPDRAIELPMLAVSTALQASLRAQQRYARLAARGDDVINRRTPTEDPPPWATFDAPLPSADLPGAPLPGADLPGADLPRADNRDAALDDSDLALRARAARQLVDSLLADSPPHGSGRIDEDEAGESATVVDMPTRPRSNPSPGKRASKRTPAKKSPAVRSQTDQSAASTKPTTVGNAAAKKAPARRSPAKKNASRNTAAKTISAPRHTAPSRFDTVDQGKDGDN